MSRRRLTWNDRKASAAPAIPGYDEPSVHPAAYPDPEADAYENGDTSAWAEDVHKGPYGNSMHPALPGTEEPQGHPATDPGHYFPAGVSKQARQQLRVAMEAKAARCIRVATAMLGRKASVAAIEDQALDLMNLTERQIQAALRRLADEGGSDSDLIAFENETLTPARTAEDESEDEDEDEAKLAEMVEEESKKASLRRRASAGGQNDPTHFYSKGSKKAEEDDEDEAKLAEMVEEEESKKAALSRKAEEEEPKAEEDDAEEAVKKAAHFKRMAAYWAKKASKKAEEDEAEEPKASKKAEEDEAEEPKAEEDDKAAKKASRRRAMEEGLTADEKQMLAEILAEEEAPAEGVMADDLLLDDEMGLDDPMMVDDAGMGMDADDMALIYGSKFASKKAEEDEEPKAEEDEEPKASKKAAVRPQPRLASKGVKTLGAVSKVASENDLSKLWVTAPDVSKIFG